ncbi:hypothetical protein BaRGS_00025087, partial [Batillaria attramentaria]
MAEKLEVRRQIPPPANSAASYRLQQQKMSITPASSAKREACQRKLQAQIFKGDEGAVQTMIDKGMAWDEGLCPTTYKETPLHAAIRANNQGLAQKLLCVRNLMTVSNVYEEQPLHLACRMGQADLVQDMLNRGADKNAEDCEKCTPLFHAVSGGSASCAKLLIDAGCDLDATNTELISPLDHALMYKDSAMIGLLLRAGCCTEKVQGHIYYRDHYANSFFFALWSGNCLESMKLFLDCGYRVSKLEMSTLKETSQRLKHEKEAHDLLRDATEQPFSLLSCCRQTIRRILMDKRRAEHTPLETMVSGLNVPKGIKDYLLLKDRADSQPFSSMA